MLVASASRVARPEETRALEVGEGVRPPAQAPLYEPLRHEDVRGARQRIEMKRLVDRGRLAGLKRDDDRIRSERVDGERLPGEGGEQAYDQRKRSECSSSTGSHEPTPCVVGRVWCDDLD